MTGLIDSKTDKNQLKMIRIVGRPKTSTTDNETEEVHQIQDKNPNGCRMTGYHAHASCYMTIYICTRVPPFIIIIIFDSK